MRSIAVGLSEKKSLSVSKNDESRRRLNVVRQRVARGRTGSRKGTITLLIPVDGVFFSENRSKVNECKQLMLRRSMANFRS